MGKSGYALFFDIDGTLYFNGKISDENVRELNRVRDSGNMIFINTGRSYGYCPPELKNGDVRWNGFVCGSSFIIADGRVLCDVRLTADCVRHAVEFGCRRKIAVALEGIDRAYFIVPDGVNASFADTDTFLRSGAVLIRDGFDRFLSSDAVNEITKLSFIAPLSPDDLREFDGDLWFIHFDRYTEGILKGFDKGTGISVVERALSVPHEKTVAIGDSDNDLAALDYAKTSVVVMHEGSTVENYPATVKTEGDPTTAVARYLRENF